VARGQQNASEKEAKKQAYLERTRQKLLMQNEQLMQRTEEERANAPQDVEESESDGEIKVHIIGAEEVDAQKEERSEKKKKGKKRKEKEESENSEKKKKKKHKKKEEKGKKRKRKAMEEEVEEDKKKEKKHKKKKKHKKNESSE